MKKRKEPNFCYRFVGPACATEEDEIKMQAKVLMTILYLDILHHGYYPPFSIDGHFIEPNKNLKKFDVDEYFAKQGVKC